MNAMLFYVKWNAILDSAHSSHSGKQMCVLLVYMCVCVPALSLENDIHTKKDQKKVSKVIDRLKNVADGENVRGVNIFCQRNDTKRVRKWKHYINTYILSTNTGQIRPSKTHCSCWSQKSVLKVVHMHLKTQLSLKQLIGEKEVFILDRNGQTTGLKRRETHFWTKKEPFSPRGKTDAEIACVMR